MIIVKQKQNVEAYSVIVSVFFDYLMDSKIFAMNSQCVSELLRYSLCVLFDLESKGATEEVEFFSKGCIERLKIVANDLDLFSKSKEYKQGLLEACVHSMEMTRMRLGE